MVGDEGRVSAPGGDGHNGGPIENRYVGIVGQKWELGGGTNTSDDSQVREIEPQLRWGIYNRKLGWALGDRGVTGTKIKLIYQFF